MFTEYNSQNVYENPVSNEKQEKPNPPVEIRGSLRQKNGKSEILP